MPKQLFFTKQYLLYHKKIHNYVFYRTGQNNQLADDLTSEIFLKAYNKLDQFIENKSFRAWIYRIAHNHIIDYYRSNKKIESLNQLPETKELVANQTDFTKTLSTKDQIQRILKKLKKENKFYHDLLSLKYFGECTTDEIAEILNITPNNVYVSYHRALKHIKTLIDQNG